MIVRNIQVTKGQARTQANPESRWTLARQSVNLFKASGIQGTVLNKSEGEGDCPWSPQPPASEPTLAQPHPRP
jgi:hypothetical protein